MTVAGEHEPAAPDPVTPRHTARWLAVGVLVIAAGLVAVLATRPPAAVDEVQNPVVGKVAPPIGGQTWPVPTTRCPGRPESSWS